MWEAKQLEVWHLQQFFYFRGNIFNDIVCMLNYHDETFFGLARSDYKLINKSQKEWTVSSKVKRRGDERNIKQLLNLHNDINYYIN